MPCIPAPLSRRGFFMMFEIERRTGIGAQHFKMGAVIKLKGKEEEEMMRT